MGHYDKYNSFWDESQTIINNQGYYGSYVHGSYYSIIQLITHLLIRNGVYTDSQSIFDYFNSNRADIHRENPEYDKIGFHVFLQIELSKKITSLNDDDKRDFLINFPIVKTFRKNADYDFVEIPSNKYHQCTSSFNKLKEILERQC